ncbi:hypothetical protein MOX02_01160 [Methylobacterium oxalidis]|uniref:ABC transporter domain-containing protein n=1 Tax=Methylobacterium oxalidis TaxID=944322 RepID=A0A512IWH9_9HYPH|nr:hypothetical protein MOX02_01160 [Methylobacterium oxalidis]GJE35171.1 hypothetical protein LDDCCGHA_5389 [Methylobacterium oxalidis]GLS62023.1 hypothetical protein GCM10007888_04040 [Methylobacterium oxalidis]
MPRSLVPWKQGLHTIALAPKVRGLAGGAEAARAVLARVGLADLADRYPAERLGGRRRVEIARVLIDALRLLLIDEPRGALHARTRPVMQALLPDTRARRLTNAASVRHDIGEMPVPRRPEAYGVRAAKPHLRGQPPRSRPTPRARSPHLSRASPLPSAARIRSAPGTGSRRAPRLTPLGLPGSRLPERGSGTGPGWPTAIRQDVLCKEQDRLRRFFARRRDQET